MKGTVEQRFWAYTAIIPFHDCWEWVGSKSGYWPHAYGSLKVNKKNKKAHRISWEIHFGKIPEGIEVCHTCDNPGCVRPDHLFLGTHKENMLDREKKKRRVPAKGEKQGRAVFTEKQVKEIRRLYKGKYGQISDLAKKFKVSRGAIHGVIFRITWKHI